MILAVADNEIMLLQQILDDVDLLAAGFDVNAAPSSENTGIF